MNERTVFLFIHVLVAVFGVGPLSAIVILGAKPEGTRGLVALSRMVQWGLLLSLLTGVGLLWTSGWAYLRAPWMHVSLTLFVAVGALTGIASGRLRKTAEPTAAQWARFRQLMGISYALALVIVIAMVVKPS